MGPNFFLRVYDAEGEKKKKKEGQAQLTYVQ
jgi:hypothetical protein